jgi:hypothetical protein
MRMRERAPWLLSIHCAAHRIQLAAASLMALELVVRLTTSIHGYLSFKVAGVEELHQVHARARAALRLPVTPRSPRSKFLARWRRSACSRL